MAEFALLPPLDHVADRKRISCDEALSLYRQKSLLELARQANEITEQQHPKKIRTYVIERNINYTNICRSRCSFCAFSVSPQSKRGYVLSPIEINRKIEELHAAGGAQILLQGGLHPGLDFVWCEKLLQGIKTRFPDLHIHAFSPPELIFFAKQFDLSVATVIARLRQAGLDSIPGGGAEILNDRVRRLVAPAKCSSRQWLEVMRTAHRMGIYTTATMMFGHVETLAERIEHLDQLRRLQDESLSYRRRRGAGGIFTAFTAWPFQPGRTRLGRFDQYDPESSEPRRENQLVLAGAYEYLKMTALSRIFLDNFANHQASWVTQGPAIAQLSLHMGCNDAGSVMMEENVVSAAGTSFAMELSSLRRLISAAGFTPVQRDYYYRLRAPGGER